MSGFGVINELPQYLQNPDYAWQEPYQGLLNLALTSWFNSSGFWQPTLTNAQVAQLMAQTPPLPNGTHWLNSDKNKMEFVGSDGIVQTITSV